MRPSPAKLTLAVTVIFALACGKGGASDVEANCGDGLDDDGDNFVDCDDAECQIDPICDEDPDPDPDEEDCDNGDDDDGDDDVDCDDIDCASSSACDGGDEELCANGEDDDGDGDVDCDDSDCFDKPACDDVPQDEDCNNGSDDDDDGDVDCDDSDCFSDSDCASGDYFDPAYFNVTGGFGYNSSTRKVVAAYDDAGSTIPPFVQVVFMEEDYLSTGDEMYVCYVLWAYDSTTALPLAIMTDSTEGVTHGGFQLTLTSDSAWSASTDCNLDPAVYGDPIDWVRDNFGDIGVGVGKTSYDVQTTIDDQVDPADAVYFGGAGAWMAGAYGAPNYAFGYETDSSMNLTYDGSGSNVPLLASEYALTSGVPAHGYYQTSLLFVYAL